MHDQYNHSIYIHMKHIGSELYLIMHLISLVSLICTIYTYAGFSGVINSIHDTRWLELFGVCFIRYWNFISLSVTKS